MSLPTLCRLCLYNTDDYLDLAATNPDKLREKIVKFLHIEIDDNDVFPKTICQKCIQRLEHFHEFYQEVAQNQEMLQYSQPVACGDSDQQIIITDEVSKTTTTASFIQLPPGFNLKGVVTLQTVPNGVTAFDLDADAANIDLQHYEDLQDATIVTKTTDSFQTIEDEQPRELITDIRISDDCLLENTDVISAELNTVSLISSSPVKQVETVGLDAHFGSTNTETQSKSGAKMRLNRSRRVGRKSVKETETSEVIVENMEYEEVIGEDGDHTDADDIYNGTNLANTEITDSLKIESEIEVFYNDVDNDVDNDNDDDEVEADESQDTQLEHIDLDNEKFAGFPKYIIKDSKLIIRGKQLVDLMSRFYRLECDLCPAFKNRQKFTRLGTLYHHYVHDHTMKGYVICCGIKLIKPRAMAMHMARHLQPEAFTCPECNKVLTCPKILQYHMQNHLPEEQRPLACPDCPRKFSYSSALVAHAISHQPESQRVLHVCDECGKVFVSAGRLTTHINVTHMLHGQDYICHICAKQFACRSNLTYHLTTHQPRVHQVQCDKCGKWLKNKLCLRKHMVQHSTIRYGCTMCNYSALNRQCLRNHIKVQHSDVKPFSCEVCGKTFKLKNTMLNHMVQHTGVRKFSCPFCSRTFASSGNYYTHRKRMHPQELAALKQKQEEEERVLREQALTGFVKEER